MVFNLNNYINKNFKNISFNYQKIIQDDFILYKAFFIACFQEKNLNILQIIIDENQNINCLDDDGNNRFCIACENNQNIDIIKYLIKLNIDVEHKNKKGNNGLLLACSKNENIEIIKYLIDDLFKIKTTIDTKFQNYLEENPFLIACRNNKNIYIIKYLISDLKVDIKRNNKNNLDGFLLARIGNNVKILNYLIEEVRMNVTKKRIKKQILNTYDNDEFEYYLYSLKNSGYSKKHYSELLVYMIKRKYYIYFFKYLYENRFKKKLNLLTFNSINPFKAS